MQGDAEFFSTNVNMAVVPLLMQGGWLHQGNFFCSSSVGAGVDSLLCSKAVFSLYACTHQNGLMEKQVKGPGKIG